MGHPSRDIIGSYGNSLATKRIALGITGSVAAVRSPEIARLLMRYGADVFPVMSPASLRIIHPDLMEWATGNKAVTQLTGAIEHVALAGNVPDRCDLVLIAPATANTVGKIAWAIDDTPVTTLATTALGEGIPMLIVPAMHEPMYRHPLVGENIARLTAHGVHFILPRIEEGKAKIATDEEILDEVTALIGAVRSLSGKRVLVTAGRTVEYIDPVRVITNNSTGKMGVAIAEACRMAGAEVTLVHGKLSIAVPRNIPSKEAATAREMQRAVLDGVSNGRYDVVVAAAAVGDWRPESPFADKVPTRGRSTLDLRLVPTEKIIDRIKELNPEVFLVAFRALQGKSTEELIADAHQRLLSAKADLIAVNDVGAANTGFESDTNELFLVDADRKIEHIPLATKRAAADRLVAAIAGRLGGRVS